MGGDSFKIGKAEIHLVQGDITEMLTDAIVNAANSSLMGGGGVDGAIHSKGGPQIVEECRKIRSTQYPDGLPAGQAIITTGGKLKARHVIHTVGPVWHGGKRDEHLLLWQAYTNSLHVAVKNGLKTVAFPSISTGAYGYPVELASHEALSAVKEFLQENDGLDQVVFVPFSKAHLDTYRSAAAKILGTPER